MKKSFETILIIVSALIATAIIGGGIYVLNMLDRNMTTADHVVEDISGESDGDVSEETSDKTIVTFTINTQDFSYPENSAEMMQRLLTLHEQYDIPLSISFNHPMIDYYSQEQPELWNRLSESPLISFGYHTRPPLPYHSSTPHSPGTKDLTDEELQDYILWFETHGLDLETGISTQEAGGFGLLTELLGDRPYTVGVSVDDRVRKVLEVYKDLGAVFFAGHTGDMWLGDTIGPLHIRPEQEEIKAFEHTSEDAKQLLTTTVKEVNQSDDVPTFINIKMHDNDFFAEQSAWTAVYLSEKSRRLGTPFDLSQVSALLSEEEQESIWVFYEDLLRTVAEDDTLETMTVEDIYELVR